MAERDRLERILALVLLQSMKGASQQERIVQLSLAGFTNYEIADLLQTTTGVVAQSLYTARRSSKPAAECHAEAEAPSREGLADEAVARRDAGGIGLPICGGI